MTRPHEYRPIRRLSQWHITPDPLQIRDDPKGKRKMPTSEKDAAGRSRLLIKLRSHWPRAILAATALAIVMTAPAPAVAQDADKDDSDQSLVEQGWGSCIRTWLCIGDPEVERRPLQRDNQDETKRQSR